MENQSRKDMIKYERLSEIPDGEVITGKGKVLAIPENQRDIFAAVCVSEKDHAYILVLATEKHISSQFVMQFHRRCKDEGITEFKNAVIPESLLKDIYAKTDQVFNEENPISKKVIEIIQKILKPIKDAIWFVSRHFLFFYF